MANNPIHYTCYFIMLIVFIDQGDGHWKRKDGENLQRDIEIFKKMAEKIEHEIETFYDEYTDERIQDNDINKIHDKYPQKATEAKKGMERNDKAKQDFSYLLSTNITNNISNDVKGYITKERPSDKAEPKVDVSFRSIAKASNYKSDVSISNWPKFEEILLAMGKRYDWKNDRWIKVKGKLKESRMKNVKDVNNSIEFHAKHKFSYRTVKLNRIKSRRNVVIAVSAVR